jgi:predicted nucleotidyltransferase
MNSRRDHGLPPATVERIVGVLERFPSVEHAVIFGSRAKGTHKPGSDIDLALSGQKLEWREIGKLDDALDDLLLPYRFSLICHDAHTDPEVAAHIARVGIPLFTRDHATA